LVGVATRRSMAGGIARAASPAASVLVRGSHKTGTIMWEKKT
jgi:hypothetical protein